ncbi:MAG: site-specific integrase [Acidobacteria bacterium]|nr:site-specific integrase [Acidobacteriota bacterium]
MARPRTGSITFDNQRKLFVVRLTYHDEAGKRRDLRRTAETKTEALRLLTSLKRDLDHEGAQFIDGDRLTFQKLAEQYTEKRLTEPIYRDGQKVAGLRSWQDQRRRLKLLSGYFGKRLVKAVTFADLEAYKKRRLESETRDGGERSIASVNRELALLRSIFGFAKQSGWIGKSPFEQGKAIISTALEAKRERVLRRDEEERLLAACDCRERRHLRPVIIAALDTGARRGELLRLRWSDVNLAEGLIEVTSYKGKKAASRTIGMTARLRIELERLYERSPKDPSASVFGIKAGFRKAFDTACAIARIEDFRFHDCRHTALTRMVESKELSHVEIMKLSGHSQFQTFARYVNTSGETARRQAKALDEMTRQIEEDSANEFVN